jgi:4-oxalocrotonate tautomerase
MLTLQPSGFPAPSIDFTELSRLRDGVLCVLADTEGAGIPHIAIKHFPAALSAVRQEELISSVTRAVQAAFGCEAGVVSIALEQVEPEAWREQVYLPEIVGRAHLLRKKPTY